MASRLSWLFSGRPRLMMSYCASPSRAALRSQSLVRAGRPDARRSPIRRVYHQLHRAVARHQDLGERLVPFINTVADFYNLESAADLRREPVMLFNRLIGKTVAY